MTCGEAVRGRGGASDMGPCLEDRGIPARRLQSLAASHGLSDQVARLEGESTRRLQAECERRSLPFAALVDKEELVACLTAVLVWERLPTAELRRELRQWSARATGSEPHQSGDTGQQTSEELSKQLVSALWGALREARGLPAERLGKNVAEALFKEVLCLEARAPATIEADYQKELKKLNVPPEVGAGRRYHLDCLTRTLVLEELPMAQLKKECLEYGVQARKSGEPRHELAQQLFVRTMCRDNWERRGILVEQLGPRRALKVAERHQRLEQLSDEELEAEHEALQLPKEAELQPRRAELLSRLKAASMWQEMPIEELLDECRKIGLATDELEDSSFSEKAVRRKVVELLVTGICLTPWEAARWEERGVPVRRLGDVEAANKVIRRVTQLEAMDEGTLKAEYAALGLPPEAGQVPQGRAALLNRLRCAAYWRELPLNELRRECQELRVSNGGLGSQMSDAEKRGELAERLMIAKWADVWMGRSDVPVGRLGSIQAVAGTMRDVARLERLPSDALRHEYGSIGLPSSAFKTPEKAEDLLGTLKRVVFWKAMPLDELREECMKLSVSFRSDASRNASTEQQCGELVERLLMAACADAWQARGIPVKRLTNIQTAVDLAEQWDRLEGMGSADLQKEYGKLGLPREAEMPKVLELLPRLKLASLWRALPLSELQKECRKLGASACGDQQEAVQRLVMASWGASKASVEGEGGDKPGRPPLPGNARELLQSTAKHFQTMGLAANANTGDLKKAYRQLVLQHHPDKNPGLPQDAAKKKFQEVTEAYEALCDFMKQKF